MRYQSLNEVLKNYGEKEDFVTLDIPLLIRLFEYSREDAKQDLDLHIVAKNMIRLSKEKGQLSVHDYNQIIDLRP